jgi:hypothetical protein
MAQLKPTESRYCHNKKGSKAAPSAAAVSHIHPHVSCETKHNHHEHRKARLICATSVAAQHRCKLSLHSANDAGVHITAEHCARMQRAAANWHISTEGQQLGLRSCSTPLSHAASKRTLQQAAANHTEHKCQRTTALGAGPPCAAAYSSAPLPTRKKKKEKDSSICKQAQHAVFIAVNSPRTVNEHTYPLANNRALP